MDESMFYRLFHRLSDYYILPRVYAQWLLVRILQALNSKGNKPMLKCPNDDDKEQT